MPDAFTHQSLRTRVVCRPGALAELASEIRKLGARRPLLLCSARMARSPLYGQVKAQLQDVGSCELTDVPPHSSVETVMRIADLARARQSDVFVCLGGGSVSDSAKAAALVLAEGAPLARHASRFVPPDTVITPDLLQPKLPIITLPMTASGAEVTPSLGIRTAEGHKLLFWDAQLASRVLLLDAEANLAMPAALMLSTAMNGLAHCLEGLYSKARSPLTTSLALDGLVRFDRAIRQVAQDPRSMDARGEMLIAANLSGMVLASARSCLHHAICHVLGASHGAPHGEVNSVILPHALAFNAEAARALLAVGAERLALPHAATDPAQALVDWLRDLQQVAGVPTRLRDLGVAAEALPAAAQKTLHERGLAFNPRPVTLANEVEAILRAAW